MLAEEPGVYAFRLETASTLGGAWSPAAGTPASNGGTTTQIVPASGTAAFYRLTHP